MLSRNNLFTRPSCRFWVSLEYSFTHFLSISLLLLASESRERFALQRNSFKMAGSGSYVPPQYIPLHQSESEADKFLVMEEPSPRRPVAPDPSQWSSGICACCDDMQSCVIGTICPCFLFGKNANFLGSGTLSGSCMTHFILWGLVNSLCCLFSGGIIAFFPGAMVACYACGYRKALRVKYNLQEAPCGDLTTHLFCHPCAICQEYREIRERSDGSTPSFTFTNVTAPPIQSMDLPEK